MAIGFRTVDGKMASTAKGCPAPRSLIVPKRHSRRHAACATRRPHSGADAVDVGLHHDRPEGSVDPPPRLEEGREERARAELGVAQLDVARLGGEEPAAGAFAVGRALIGPLVSSGPDRLGRLELDKLLEDEGHRLAHDIGAAAGANGVEQAGQGRL